MGPYNVTKAAIVALSETLKFELDAEGSHVGVSVLCPSWVRTNLSTADRNLPERFAYELETEQMEQLEQYKAKRREQRDTLAIEPSAVADQVCAAVKENRFYVITHPESVARVRRAGCSHRGRREPDRAASVSGHAHDRDRATSAARLHLVVGVRRIDADHQRPQSGPLGGVFDRCRDSLHDKRLLLDRHLRVGHEVEVPERVLRTTAVRRDKRMKSSPSWP